MSGTDASTPELDLVKVKLFNSLAAEAALLGFSLHKLADGGFIVSRWNLSKTEPDLDGVRAFLDRVTAATRRSAA